MIPKIIHYVWLGNPTIPDELTSYINTWRKFLIDYKIIRWDFTKFKNELRGGVEGSYLD